MTARAYLGMVRMEDSLRSHQNFVRATVGMVEIYLDLHKNPKSEEDDLSPEEKKKLAAKVCYYFIIFVFERKIDIFFNVFF